MTEPEQQPGYTPPFPDPRASRPNLLGRFRAFTRSWLNVFFANSYRMKSGTFRIPGKRYFIINDAPEVKSVLSAGAEAYPKGPVLQRMLRLLLGDGIFISNGAVWRRQRDMMEQALTLSHIRLVFPMMQSAVNQLLQRLQASPENQLNISEEMAYVTADIIFRTIYTKPLTAEESALIFRSFARYQKRVARLSPLFFIGARPEWFRWLLDDSARAIRGVIRDNARPRFEAYHNSGQDDHDDILSGMLQSQDESGRHFTLEELTDQIAVLFLAGHETSATTLSWAFYILARCPHLQDQIRREVASVTADSGVIEYSHIRKLKASADVFRETLRLYPPVGGFVREATCPVKVRDKKITPGDAVVVIPWLLHRREDKWPETHEFHPERFSCPEQQDTIRNYYYPFSAGERVCIGAGFANQEAILIIASVVSHFDILPVAGCDPQPIGHITIKPDQNIRLQLRPR
ncbi:MAG TPA: cytochrome P450 [Oceanospirillales bacterium]|nr:cytochrome P450 [Oceanospirillaceae bacterium]HBS41804.1 cytochrome P450 [Oceanospirillales bacterium]|tara:strand:+ start:548 stop:1930 length:1383 start_codon:yes stop_codon:yes gene_type:complete